jgi:hypothetical protein
VDRVHTGEDEGAKSFGMVVEDMVQEAMVEGYRDETVCVGGQILPVVNISQDHFLQSLQVSDSIKYLGMGCYVNVVKPYSELTEIRGALKDYMVNQIYLVVALGYDESDIPEIPGEPRCKVIVQLGLQRIHL